MRALLGVPHPRATALLVAVACVFCVLILVSTQAAIAKTRPPIEMGDPDDTGNHGQIPGPPSRAKVTSSAATPTDRSAVVAKGFPATLSFMKLLRHYLTIWRPRY